MPMLVPTAGAKKPESCQGENYKLYCQKGAKFAQVCICGREAGNGAEALVGGYGSGNAVGIGGAYRTGGQNGEYGMGGGYGSGLEGGVDGIEEGYIFGLRNDAYGMGSGANGVEGETGSTCDTRKGYDGNPDCETGKRCVPTILNLGECRTVKAQLENTQADASFFGCHGRKITLRTQYRDAKYLRALPDGHRVNANGTSNDHGIQFEVEDLQDLPKGARKIALKSIYGKYLTAIRPAMGPIEPWPVSNVTAHSTWLWKGAIFEVKHNANNLYWFKTEWKVNNQSRYLLPYTNGYIRGDGKHGDLRRR